MDGVVETAARGPRSRGRDAAKELAEREQFDAAALHIAERVRSSLSLEDVLQQTVDELGYVVAASRCLIQLEPNARGECLMIEWDRGDTRPLGIHPPTPIARHVFESASEVVIAEAEDEECDLAQYLRGVGSVSAIAFPVRWHNDRVVAVISFQDSEPREWRRGVLPLLRRLEGQLAAAFAQAELFGQQQRALEELKELERMRVELVATVSHEVRTPLAAILGLVKTLRRDDVAHDHAQRAELLAVLDEQTDRLADLASDLLDFSRYRNGKQRLELERVPFSRLLAQALREIPMPAGRHLHLDVDDCEIEADGNRIVQVLTNLLLNAIRHGSGDVYVSCRRGTGSVVLHFGDDGHGLVDGREEEMFQPFAHASDRSDSTGLGLPISRAIVEAHGGSLHYLPRTLERRHEFVVTLPTPKGRQQVEPGT